MESLQLSFMHLTLSKALGSSAMSCPKNSPALLAPSIRSTRALRTCLWRALQRRSADRSLAMPLAEGGRASEASGPVASDGGMLFEVRTALRRRTPLQERRTAPRAAPSGCTLRLDRGVRDCVGAHGAAYGAARRAKWMHPTLIR